MLKKIVTATLKDVKVIDSKDLNQAELTLKNQKEASSSEEVKKDTKLKEPSDDNKVESSTTN